jgi:hypothetical protein
MKKSKISKYSPLPAAEITPLTSKNFLNPIPGKKFLNAYFSKIFFKKYPFFMTQLKYCLSVPGGLAT